ncbi:TetR/AcrR family transcriptional regulator [Endozoicomonas gorgoniicola]|uniref:TetR/AcrR family transcriptional regulator n=1 Tax=Endozoicomonas gorgoniicola TaxID=1234144 RepID=A0ABT3MX17_9GAMM|nr:TetR/AcrR family transcriptional regulator [Endozoicomonas gorgoniicola]MCW7553925.1 TetR/AcrR family transcriptional regulator [Endozoicomonas gorgoniicola]
MVVGTSGRPRSFNQETALEEALKIFWSQGYEGASVKDLTKAMGINKPSMYDTFGNKEELFLKAVDMYIRCETEFFFQALELDDIHQVITSILQGSAQANCSEEKPKGCLIIQGALVCSSEASTIKQALIKCRNEMSEVLQRRFEKARKEGQLVDGANPKVMCHYLTTVLNGLSVHSVDDTSKQMIHAVSRMAIENLHSYCINVSATHRPDQE